MERIVTIFPSLSTDCFMKGVMSILEVEPWITREQCVKSAIFTSMKTIATQAVHSLYTCLLYFLVVYTEFTVIFSLVYQLQGGSRVFEVGMHSPYTILGQWFGKCNDSLMQCKEKIKDTGSSLNTNLWHCISYWSLAVKFKAQVSGL